MGTRNLSALIDKNHQSGAWLSLLLITALKIQHREQHTGKWEKSRRKTRKEEGCSGGIGKQWPREVRWRRDGRRLLYKRKGQSQSSRNCGNKAQKTLVSLKETYGRFCPHLVFVFPMAQLSAKHVPTWWMIFFLHCVVNELGWLGDGMTVRSPFQ